jgi:hypothetical protein
MLRIGIVLAVFVAAGAASAADVLLQPYEVMEHRRRMVDAGGLEADLKAALDAAALPKAAGAGEKLSRVLGREIRYWEKAGLPDALGLARRNIASASAVAASARAGRLEAARADFAEMQTTCVACHELHPENRVLVAR